MRISDIASSPPVTCHPQTPLAQVLNLMVQHDIGAVAVVDRDGCLVGIVTDRDIAVRAFARKLDPDTQVAQVMTTEPVAVAADADLDVALNHFAARGARRIPVLDDERRVVGLVTLDDVILHGASQLDQIADAVRSQARPGAHRRASELDRLGEHRTEP